MQLLFSFDQDTRVEKTLMQTLASQLSSTLMQILFSFDRDMRVEKTLMQTSCFSDSTLMQTLASQISCKLSLLNSHQLSCNSCSRLTVLRELRNSHANSRFSTLINSCSRLTRARELRNSHANSRFSTLILV